MKRDRLHYVDWLRFASVVAVVIFHALLPFGSFQPWLIQNDERSDILALASALLPFAFPLFFLLAGVSARYALRARSVPAFLAERGARLLVPFAVGTVLLTPPTAHVIGRANGTAPPTFLAFLADYPGELLDYIVANVGVSPMALQVVGMHLWFLAWLFLWCVIAVPVVLGLSTARGASLVGWLARHTDWPGGSLVFAIPLLLLALPLFRISSTAGWDWAVFGLWGGTFVCGYVVFGDDRLLAGVRRDLLPALGAAVLGIGGLAATGFTDSIFRGGAHTSDLTYLLVVGFHALSVWGVTLSIMSAGMRVPFMQRPLPARASQWALPLYVLHYPIVIAVSAMVVDWPLGLWPKAAVNVSLGIGLTLVAVATAVRIAVLRPLLGLRGSRSDAAPTSHRPVGHGDLLRSS